MLMHLVYNYKLDIILVNMDAKKWFVIFEEKYMTDIINKVFNQKDEIINLTTQYQKYNINKKSNVNLDEYEKMFEYFNKNFNEDEIKIIQSIMYFGRECFTGSGVEYKGNKYKVVSIWMRNLNFLIDEKIKKDVEINQMLEKGQMIGTYFEYGFKELERV